MENSKETGVVNLKSSILEEISSIEDTNLLEEISIFLELKKKAKRIKDKYGKNLYDTLNKKEDKELWENEKKLYIELVKLLKKLKKGRKGNYGIEEKNKNLFDPNEPVIKDLLSKSYIINEIGLEKWIKTLYDQGVRSGNHHGFMQDREHYVVFKDGKLKYDVEIRD